MKIIESHDTMFNAKSYYMTDDIHMISILSTFFYSSVNDMINLYAVHGGFIRTDFLIKYAIESYCVDNVFIEFKDVNDLKEKLPEYFI